MEVDLNIIMLGVTEGMEIVPPPCTNMGVCMPAALVIDAMFLVVVIVGINVCKFGLEGL